VWVFRFESDFRFSYPIKGNEGVSMTSDNTQASGFVPAEYFKLTLLLVLIFIYPFLGMFWHHGYPVFTAETCALLLVILVGGACLSFLLQYSRPLVQNFALVGVLTLVFIIHFNLLFLGLVAVLAVSIVLSLLLGRKFQQTVLVLIIALTVGAWFDNRIDSARNLPGLLSDQESSATGPLIHLVMDAFIGPDGLPADEDAQVLREEIISFFKTNDFELHTRAYTHYFGTLDSLTRAFNFRNDDESILKRTQILKQKMSVKENAWFQALQNIGYPIVVYQTESMDFCSVDLPEMISCNTFNMPNLKTVHEGIQDIGTRVRILFSTLLRQSLLISDILASSKLLGSWGVSVYDKRIFTHLSRDIQQDPGRTYFAHVLLPHSPLVLQRDCSLDYETPGPLRFPASKGLVNNSEDSRNQRYPYVLRQMYCALTELELFFSFLKSQDLFDKATIVVHGDHGTLARKFSPDVRIMDQLEYRDMKEIFSTLFAVKFPGGQFSLNNEMTSLNVLMAQTLSRITGKSTDDLGITVSSEEEPFVYMMSGDVLMPAYLDFFREK